MLPYWCLVDILKCLSRDDLERIQVTNHQFNNIVSRDFADRPLRVLPYLGHVQIRNHEIAISIRRMHRCFVPHTRKWNQQYCSKLCEHYYSVEVLQPFLCKNVRFISVDVFVSWDDFTQYTAVHIATLESISHIWDAQNFKIFDLSTNDSSSLNTVLGSSIVLRCRTLYIIDRRRRIAMLQNPNVYSINAIDLMGLDLISTWNLNGDEILQLIEQKAFYPHSDTIFTLFSSKDSIEEAMNIFSQEFLTSENRCRLRLIVGIRLEDGIPELHLKNSRTNEVLELKHISNEQAKDKFDVDIYSTQTLLLERRTCA